ncbi:uncharacterized protein M6B38_261440 [Iris pallida]|uniref:Reverse transcriptase domain-containing protein n=1 Tax=Iris pallida TaxID=29817 RepID=A0AAX6IBZ2_IRIPA|nr:uncharacterized protein M6B38_261440 [Iris pallida]
MADSNRGSNVALKLDRDKAYDRVDWQHFLWVLKKFGFDNKFVDIIFRLISNIWFSILSNGERLRFFQSFRGIRQGDPLSLLLFVIAAKSLSCNLQAVVLHRQFIPFTFPRRGPVITHLAYADDTLIFSSGNIKSIELIMKVVLNYQNTSAS